MKDYVVAIPSYNRADTISDKTLYVLNSKRINPKNIFIFVANANENIDMILVDKSLRTLQIIQKGAVIETFSIDLGFDPIGHKHFKGDGKTPEGLYFISKKSTTSDFYMALQISYPNNWDKRNAISFGKNAGDFIMIHGEPNINKNKKILKIGLMVV